MLTSSVDFLARQLEWRVHEEMLSVIFTWGKADVEVVSQVVPPSGRYTSIRVSMRHSPTSLSYLGSNLSLPGHAIILAPEKQLVLRYAT